MRNTLLLLMCAWLMLAATGRADGYMNPRPAGLRTGLTALPLPGRIQAEQYAAMSGIQTEPTADADGGQNVGWIDDNDWLDYDINVASAGRYTFNFRVANGFGDGRIELQAADGTVLSAFDVPRTGGMQSWSTVSTTAQLPAGVQRLRIRAVRGLWNFNWFEAVGARPVGKLEAEHYDVMSGIQTEPTSDAGGGLNVGWIDDNDWLDYNVRVTTAGLHTFRFRVANSYGNGQIQVRAADGSVLGSVSVPRTGGWQNWTTVTTTATLPAGDQVLRIYALQGAWNFNWFEVVAGGQAPVAAVITFDALPQRTAGEEPFDLVASSTNPDAPVTFTSSNPAVVSVSNAAGRWQATPLTAGTATITAMQAGSGTFLAAANVTRDQVVTAPAPPFTAQKIPIEARRWYQLNNATYGLDGLFDGRTDVRVETGWGKVLRNYDAYYPLLDGESMTIEAIKLYDGEGTFFDEPVTISIITDTWQRIPIATFVGQEYNAWVGPYPNRQLSGDLKFRLDAPVSNARYLVINSWSNLPTELELYGTHVPAPQPATPPLRPVRLKDMFGVNVYEWNFEDGNTPWQINETKMDVVKSFAGVRHYMDWEKLEADEGSYSYNPTMSGGWNYDAIYERCKAAGIEVLACLKTIPHWLANTYPEGERDGENVPARYGRDLTDPASYIEQAKVGFQYMARYGSNTNVNPALLSVHNTPRWNGDNPNTLKIGLGLIKYIECENERDKWWKGRKAYQTAREYAANLSAFYDGHKNTLGPGVGVKNADPSVKVVIGGLASASIGSDYVKGMIDWCKEFRGYRADGTVNLCWDVINYHMYSDNTSSSQSGTSTRGAAPEVTPINRVAEAFRQTAYQQAYDMPVWVTETGYDIHQGSPLRAIPIGPKTALDTQGDWILRTALFYARMGIDKVFFYQLYDDNDTGGMFGTSGLANANQTRRPAADYLLQVNKVFGDYTYRQTLHRDPIVDRYERNGASAYMLVVPDEIGRTASYTLDLGGAAAANIYRPKAGRDDMEVETVPTVAGKVTVTATETPMFVRAAGAGARLHTTAEPVGRPLHETARVYPNPAQDVVTIAADNNRPDELTVTVFDANLGRLHKQATLPASGKLDVSALPHGLYVIEIRQGTERAFRKLIKTE